MKKKILAFALLLAMVLSSVSAYAAPAMEKSARKNDT